MFVVSNPLAHLGTFTMPLHPKPIKRSGGGWENYFLPPLPLQKKNYQNIGIFLEIDLQAGLSPSSYRKFSQKKKI